MGCFRLPARPLPVRVNSANTPRNPARPVEPVIAGPAPSLTAALHVVSAPQTPAVPPSSDQNQQREKSEILKRLNEKMMPEKDTPTSSREIKDQKSKWNAPPNDFTFSNVELKPEVTIFPGKSDQNEGEDAPVARR